MDAWGEKKWDSIAYALELHIFVPTQWSYIISSEIIFYQEI